jgi:hypothetical protein
MSDVGRDRFRAGPLPADWVLVRAGGVPRECFADEIAIDFPSVDRCIERARDAFADGGGWDAAATCLLRADIHLSPREAWTGALIPLSVPVRRICAACGGRGESWTDPCGACLGRGDGLVRHLVRVPLPPGVADGARLRFRLSSPDGAPLRLEVLVTIPRH